MCSRILENLVKKPGLKCMRRKRTQVNSVDSIKAFLRRTKEGCSAGVALTTRWICQRGYLCDHWKMWMQSFSQIRLQGRRPLPLKEDQRVADEVGQNLARQSLADSFEGLDAWYISPVLPSLHWHLTKVLHLANGQRRLQKGSRRSEAWPRFQKAGMKHFFFLSGQGCQDTGAILWRLVHLDVPLDLQKTPVDKHGNYLSEMQAILKPAKLQTG